MQDLKKNAIYFNVSKDIQLLNILYLAQPNIRCIPREEV